MNIKFSKVSRGPAWERWVIIEEQNGEEGFGGEVIITYSDASSYAEAECDILAARELKDEEIDEILEAASTIISDMGTVTIYSTKELVSKEFSFVDEEEDEGHHHH
ncbi:MAG: hypothetical protein ACYC27_22010 [Armatimonadota bacterium]